MVPKRVMPWRARTLTNPTTYNGQAMITFSYDDGKLNNYVYAIPLHEKWNIPATFNIIGRLVRDLNMMDASRIRDAARRGFEIASHSYMHDVWLTTKTDAELHWDLYHSREVLRRITGQPVDSFAVPFSQYDNRVRDIARRYYTGVRAYDEKWVTIPPEDQYWLPSVVATRPTTTWDYMKTIIDNTVSTGRWAIIMLHGVAPGAPGTYDITPEFLDQILEYVASFGPSTLLPVNMRDGLRFALSVQK